MSTSLSKADTRAYYEAQAAEACSTPDTVPADMAYSAEVVARVEAEAAEAIALPWWFWEAAAVVFVATIAISAVFPLGFAT